MILSIDPEGRAMLLDAGDLKAFKVVGCRPDPSARQQLTDAGVELSDDDGHAFVAVDTVRRLAQQSGSLPDEWDAGFQAMVAYAASKGWTDQQGRVRAHTEWSQ